jgi:hypothetical protein
VLSLPPAPDDRSHHGHLIKRPRRHWIGDDTGLTLGKCGSQVTGQARTDLPLQISAAVPDEPLAANDPYPQIEMTVTNTSCSEFRIRTYRSGAYLTIIKDGIVVRPPAGKRDVAVRFTLEAGAMRTYPSNLNMLRCDPANSSIRPSAGAGKVPALRCSAFFD